MPARPIADHDGALAEAKSFCCPAAERLGGLGVHLTVRKTAIDQPVAGSTAANTQIDFHPCWRMTVGRDPFIAHTAISVPCWPKRASSWNQMRTLVRGRDARTRFRIGDAA